MGSFLSDISLPIVPEDLHEPIEQEEIDKFSEAKYQLEKALEINTLYFTTKAKKGVVDVEVISSLLRKLGIEDVGIHQYMFRYYSDYNNGEYSYYEFFNFMYSISAIHKEFISADKNGDHSISLQELHSVINHLQIDLEDSTLKQVMYIFDMNNDEVLNYGEFFMLYIFLVELKKVCEKLNKTKQIEANNMCKLLDDIEKAEIAAKEIQKIFDQNGSEISLDAFARVIVCFKDKSHL